MEPVSSTTKCTHCKRDVPSATYILHSAHCARHLVICKKCMESVPRISIEDHDKEVHGLTCCTVCKNQIEKSQLDGHLEKECPGRTLPCEFCEVDCLVSQLEEHKHFCGSRTELCEKCSNYITIHMMKDHIKLHAATNSFATRARADQTNPNDTQRDILKTGPKSSFLQQEIKSSEGTLPCEFCEVDCLMSQLEEHEFYCGSRSELCEKCSKYIIIHTMKEHIKQHAAANSFADKADQTNFNETQRDSLKTGSKNSFSQQVKPAPKIFHQPASSQNPGDSKPTSAPIKDEDGCMMLQKPKYRNVICQKLLSMKTIQAGSEFIGAKALSPEKKFLETNYFDPNPVGLPCEFCQAIQSIESFEEHQVICGSRVENCPRCKLQISGFQRRDHVCLAADIRTPGARSKHKLKPLYETDTQHSLNEISIPCLTCGLFFSAHSIDVHELSCKFSSITTEGNDESITGPGVKPLPDNIPCSICQVRIPMEILEIHEVRCARMRPKERTFPATSTASRARKPAVINRPETQQQKTMRLNALQSAESRQQSNPKIPLSKMMVVDLPDGSQILKKRENDATDVDIGHVLGRGSLFNYSEEVEEFLQKRRSLHQDQNSRGILRVPSRSVGRQNCKKVQFRSNDRPTGHQRTVPGQEFDDEMPYRNVSDEDYLGARPKRPMNRR